MKDFDYAYYNSRKAMQIQRQYFKKSSSELEQLQRLHEKVTAPGTILSVVIGVLGMLVMGAGMAEVMVWDHLQYGLCLSIPGLLMVLSAFPLYMWVTGKRKKKYANQVYALSNPIIQGEKETQMRESK